MKTLFEIIGYFIQRFITGCICDCHGAGYNSCGYCREDQHTK